jgi:uncharacterized protein (TIGR03067 family)
VAQRACWGIGLVALFLVGTARAEEVKADDLMAIGLAYHSYYQDHKRGPAKGDDLAPHLVGFDDAGKRVLGLLNSGDLVLVYDVGLDQMPEGAAKTVLAYQKGIGKTGGLVLMGDGRFKKMTPAEFKAATLAKAAHKEEKLLGKWKMESSERGGRERPVKVTQVVIKADTLTFVGPDGTESFDVEYKVDPAKKPKAIDIKNEKGDKTSPGIYSLDGDTLKICTDKPGAERPTEFATKPGTELNVIVLKRVKP